MALNRDRRQKKLLELLREDPVITIACMKAGVGRATFYRWQREDEGFADQVKEAMQIGDERYNDLAESKMMSLIQKEDIRAIMFRLNNKHPAYSYPKVLPYQHQKSDIRPVYVMPSIIGPDDEEKSKTFK